MVKKRGHVPDLPTRSGATPSSIFSLPEINLLTLLIFFKKKHETLKYIFKSCSNN